MARETKHVVHPCPSCGVPLKVHPDRVGQKMQCPKCLAIFVSAREPTDDAAAHPAAGAVPGGAADSGRGTRDSEERAELEEKVAVLQGCIEHLREERKAWAEQAREMAREHGDLARRFEKVVAAYDALAADYAEAVRACADADGRAASAPPAGEPPAAVIAGTGRRSGQRPSGPDSSCQSGP